jgi:hypothetical protein
MYFTRVKEEGKLFLCWRGFQVLGDWKLETGSWKLETGNWKLETGSWKPEAGNRKLDFF